VANSVELREERATLIAQARKTWEEAEKREGGPTEEDKQAFDRAMEDSDKLLDRAKRIEKLEAAEADLDAPNERQSRPLDSEEREREREHESRGGDRIMADFRQWMLTGEVRGALRPTQARLGEFRDTIIGTDTKGGYLIAPLQLTSDLVKSIDNEVFIRRLATKTTVTEAKKLGIRKMTARMSGANWTTEIGAVTEDTAMAFGLRELEPYKLSKLAKVSGRTLALASDAPGIITGELSYAFAITEEQAFMTGSGSSHPLGVFTASANGISTARDVSADNTATEITADGLINAKYSLKGGYQNSPTTAWIFHRDAIKMARKLKVAGTGEYIWAPGLSAGEPDRILDTPFYMSEYAPNTFTTGLYVGIIGDFRWYRIAELDVVFMQRLVELYAATDEIGFIARRWLDGAPILEEAFARVKLG
jgi:HK97 family phage major capsid protein